MKRLPAGIWALGLVSLLMDVSSEMIHALLPVYVVTALGSERRVVETGLFGTAMIEIKKGVAPGDVVLLRALILGRLQTDLSPMRTDGAGK